MNNQEFLETISRSFKKFLETGSRSNEKLKILHGEIANDLQTKLGKKYSINSLGIGEGKEANIMGRYIDKKVDITIKKGEKAVAGIGVKFVMQNYSQNSNNYFENMLGETANIRCSNMPYFQIFIIPKKMPYYDKNGNFEKWEEFSAHNIQKYIILSKDNIETSVHTPTKTLLFVFDLPKIDHSVKDKKDYVKSYQSMENFSVEETKTSYGKFQSSVIYNDYESFISKVIHYIEFLN